MPLVVKDRVKETTTTAGTGTITLDGAVSGFQSFSVIGNANTTYYAIVGQTTTEWEVGIGTYTSSGTTLSRDTVLESSNGGTKVDFSAGTKDVFCTYPAEESVDQDTPQTLTNKTFDGGTVVTANSSVDALRITQTGSGNALLVEDSANPDASPFVIDATGNVGIGITPSVALDVVGVIEAQAAATQDAIRLQGGASGTSSRSVTLTPTSLTASRTVTLPDADINFTTGLPVANGGTGATTLTANNVILGNGTSAVQFVAPGTSGNVLTSNGTTWTSAAAISLSANNAFTGANTFYNSTGQTFGTATSTQDGIIVSGAANGSASRRITIQPASLGASRTLTLPDATGTAMVSGAMPAFAAYASASQTVTLVTLTKIAIDTEQFDTASCFDTSLYRFTPNVAGYYQVNGIFRGKVATTFNTILLVLYKNGSAYNRTQLLVNMIANNDDAINISDVVYMNGSTDYIELYGYLGSVGTATFVFVNSSTTSAFSAVLVRAA